MKLQAINWKTAAVTMGMLALSAGRALAEEGGGAKDEGIHIGPMEVILVLVSIAGFALALQALVTMRGHLLRPPELSQELIACCQEGDLDAAAESARNDNSMLGIVAFAALSNAQFGKEAMEGAMADAGELEMHKLMNKVGTLGLIAAIAPMLGLTGTTLGMMETFKVMSAGGGNVTPDKMAKGISLALQCTFLGLMVAIPLLVLAYVLKSRITHIAYEISNDVNEMIRSVTGASEQGAEA